MKLVRNLVLAGLLAAVAMLPRTADAVVILSGCGGAGSDFDSACSLAELAGGGSLTIDDKLFDSFTFSSTFSWSGTAPLPGATDASLIMVDPEPSGIGTLDPGPGLVFSPTGGAWSFSSPLGVELFGGQTDVITFRVSTTDGSERIVDNTLGLEPGVITGLIGVAVAEIVKDPADLTIADKLVTADGISAPVLTDSATFLPQSEIFVTKTIDFFSEASADDAAELGVGAITQNFSQLPPPTTQVSEPGALAVFAFGLIGLGFMRRRRRADSN